MTIKIIFTIALLPLLMISSCSDTITSPSTSPTVNYTPWNVGDIRQIVAAVDSTTVLINVLFTAQRQDSSEVFATSWTYGVERPDTFYYMIRNGFFISTNLKLGSDSTNPYFEQRLGKENPTEGESWKAYNNTSDSAVFTAKYFKEQSVICGVFQNVFGFILTCPHLGKIDTLLTPFYALNVGFIGTDYDRDMHLDVKASYIKVGGKEYGKLWPAKSFGPGADILNRKKIIQYLLLGAKPSAGRFETSF
jgi:hypothetical protein